MFTWLSKLRLQTRISLLVTLGLVLIFAFMAWEGRQIADTHAEMTLQERLNLARVIAQHLDQDLERTLSRLAQVAAFPTMNLEDGDLEPEKAELRALYRPDYFSYVFLLDKDGLVLWTEPYLPDVVNREHMECPHVQETLHTGEPSIACVAHALTPLSPVISLVVPIRNPQGTFSRQGAIVGVLGAAIDPSVPPFVSIFEGMALGNTGYIQLVDENGMILAHTERQHLFQKSEHADYFISLLKDKKATVVTQMLTEEGKGTFREIIAFAPLTVAPWGVAVEQDEAEFLALSLEARRRMEVIAVVAVAVALLLVWVITLSVTRPVRKLMAASERIAAGDLTTPVPPLGQDEIGELGRHFEEMRLRLARWGEELEMAVAERTADLTASEARYRTLFDSASDGLYVTDLQGRYLDANPAACQMLGYSREELLAMDVFQVGVRGRGLSPEGRAQLLEQLQAIWRKGMTGYETQLVAKSGALIPVEMSIAPFTYLGQEASLGAVRDVTKRKQTEEEIKRRTRELSVLYTIDRAAAQSLDLDEILNDSVDKIIEVLEIEAGGIFLLEPDGETMTLRVHRGLSDEFVRAVQHIRLGEGISGRAAAEGKPVVLDVPDYPSERLAPYVVREGFQTLGSTPLLSAGQLVGALNLATRRPRAFPPEELELLTAIGRQLGGAVQNARLYEETRQRLEELTSLQEAAMAVAGELELPRVLDRIVEKAASSLGFPFSAIFLLDAAHDLLHVRAVYGLSERYFRGMEPVPLGVGLVGRAAAERQPVVSEDLANEPRMQAVPHNLQVALEEGIRAVLVVPMLTKGKIVGTLSVYTKSPQVFAPEQMRLLSTFADQAAIATENARLFEAERARTERLSLLNHIAHACSTTLNLDELLEIVYREISAVMDAEVFFIALYDHAANELDYRIQVDKGIREPAERKPLLPNLTGSVITSKQPRLIRDCEKEVGPPPPETLWGSMQAAQSWLGVPMLVGDDLVGVISVQAYHPNAFSPADQELLSTIADAVAVAIENARLYSAEQRHATRLDALQRLSIELATLREEGAMLNTLVTRAAALADSPACTVMLVGEATNEAVLAAQTGLPEGTPLGLRVPLTLPILHHSLETGEPIIVPDVDRDAPEIRPLLVRRDIQAFFAYPMVRQGRALGWITLSSLTPRTPSKEESTAYRLLAERAAAAMENARLFQSAEEARATLEAKVRGLERFTRLAVGRELQMKELKEKMRELEERGGKGAGQ